MRRCIIAITVLAAVLALMVGPAGAHKATYKGHGCVYWTLITPGGGAIDYRECWIWGYGAGPHYHDYKTAWYKASSNSWVLVHYHDGRSAPPHPA